MDGQRCLKCPTKVSPPRALSHEASERLDPTNFSAIDWATWQLGLQSNRQG